LDEPIEGNRAMSETPKWKQFEDLVAEIQRELTPDAKVSRNVKRKGRSGTDRQIDVLVQARVGQFEFTIVIECKHHKVPIDITDVEAFISKVEDIGATKGAMVVSPASSQGHERVCGLSERKCDNKQVHDRNF
jgi:Restriction endonuclease